MSAAVKNSTAQLSLSPPQPTIQSVSSARDSQWAAVGYETTSVGRLLAAPLCLSLCFCHSLSLGLCICLCVSRSLPLSLFLSVSWSLPAAHIPLCPSVSLCVSLLDRVSWILSLSLFLSQPLSDQPSLFLSSWREECPHQMSNRTKALPGAPQDE